VADSDRDQITAKREEFVKPGVFCIPGWDGPFYTPPEVTLAFWEAHNRPNQDAWEVWVQLSDDPDVDEPERDVLPTRASIGLSDKEAMKLDHSGIARRLAQNVAGRAAHETLERATLNGERVVPPHGPREVLQEAASDIASNIYRYLMSAAQPDD
jgi:hypothetical protein